MINSHIRDAVACIDFFSFMEDEVQTKGKDNEWTEMSAQDLLSAKRLAQAHSRGDSFTTISASGSNGAVIHYRATEDTNANINRSATYLGEGTFVLEYAL